MTSDLLGEPIATQDRARRTKAPLPTFVKYRLNDYFDEINRVAFTGEDAAFYYQKKHRIEKSSQFPQYFDSWEGARAAMVARAEKTVELLKNEIKALERKIPKIKEMVEP